MSFETNKITPNKSQPNLLSLSNRVNFIEQKNNKINKNILSYIQFIDKHTKIKKQSQQITNSIFTPSNRSKKNIDKCPTIKQQTITHFQNQNHPISTNANDLTGQATNNFIINKKTNQSQSKKLHYTTQQGFYRLTSRPSIQKNKPNFPKSNEKLPKQIIQQLNFNITQNSPHQNRYNITKKAFKLHQQLKQSEKTIEKNKLIQIKKKILQQQEKSLFQYEKYLLQKQIILQNLKNQQKLGVFQHKHPKEESSHYQNAND